mmetsp:Transcript_8677/g.24033  ORF Transcript_8677/g.24033 Transcript_8677/m.24033 type:complete len:243 (-) Transcript_8677:129-857(-)
MAPVDVIISAWLGPNETTAVGSPGNLGDNGMRSHDRPESLVCNMRVGFPKTQPSPFLKDKIWNLYVTSSSASKLEKDRGSHVLPPSVVSAKAPRAPTKYPWVSDSKSMSYSVSSKGSSTLVHILEAAASAAWGGTRTPLVVTDAAAMAAAEVAALPTNDRRSSRLLLSSPSVDAKRADAATLLSTVLLGAKACDVQAARAKIARWKFILFLVIRRYVWCYGQGVVKAMIQRYQERVSSLMMR